MKHNLKFSVIIPTYNRVEFILLSLRSVLLQDYRNFEVIVVDDGSTDSTSDVVATITDPRVKYIRIDNSERAAARNTGVRAATGDYITFLDSDDQYYPDYLSNALSGLLKYRLPVFYHQAYEVRNNLRDKVRFIHSYDSTNVRFLVKGNPLSCLGVFVRRAEALMFPFNEDRELSGSEDWELWLRLAANFGLKRDEKVSACLVLHDDRSVYAVDEAKLARRKQLAMDYAFHDPEVKRVFGKQSKKMFAYSDSYNALHLVLAGKVKRGWYYFMRGVRKHPFILLERRTLAILKYTLKSKTL
jgi:glycosyltransferase involved in cell wall biosynthesis